MDDLFIITGVIKIVYKYKIHDWSENPQKKDRENTYKQGFQTRIKSIVTEFICRHLVGITSSILVMEDAWISFSKF